MWGQLLILTVTTCVSLATTKDFYTAAVLEYATQLPAGSSPDQILNTNAATYLLYMAEAYKDQVDIIVFPEEGLSHHTKGKFIELPSPEEKIAPCDYNVTYHPALVMLSCGARLNNMYVVVNLKELDVNHTTNNTAYYNSNVAFDRNGTVVGRYRKFNPYGEAVTKPKTPDHSIFTTDFGVTFGMFICFDIEFMEPGIVLARDFGVKHFIFPHCWISELPFLTALQAQWGWAYSLDVVLLASGCNDPATGGTGSGIYHGRQGALQTFQTDTHTSKLLIANVSTSFDCDDDKEESPTFVVYNEEVSGKVDAVHLVDDASKFKLGQGASNTSLVLLQDYLQVYTTLALEPPRAFDPPRQCTEGPCHQQTNSSLSVSLTTDTTLCHGNFCCHFKVQVTTQFSSTRPSEATRGDDFTRSLYRLAVFDGVRWYGGGLATGGVQVCGIVACLNESLVSCGLRADQTNTPRSYNDPTYGQLFQTGTVFDSISITPTFYYNNTFIYPDIFVSGTGDQFGDLVPSDQFTFEQFEPYNNSVLCSLRIEACIPNLVTAAVYSRQFDRDGLPRTEASNSNHNTRPGSVFTIFVIFVFIFHCVSKVF